MASGVRVMAVGGSEVAALHPTASYQKDQVKAEEMEVRGLGDRSTWPKGQEQGNQGNALRTVSGRRHLARP